MMNRRQLLDGGLRLSAGLVYFHIMRPEAAAVLQLDRESRVAQSSKVSGSTPELVAHWKLDGDCQDVLGNHHGEAHGLTFTEGVDGRAGGAASFNGIDSFVEVPDADALNFGTTPFSIAFWIKVKEDVESAPGDLMNKFDASLRRGFNLSLTGSSSGYSSFGDSKGIHFGIDNGINGSWLDSGRPWKTNPMITTLAAFKGHLYAAISDAASAEDACRIFRFEGKGKWADCGRVGNNPSTLSAMTMVVHRGQLYAGTGTWDWEKSNAGRGGRNHVYRYEGGTHWSDCGAVGNAFSVMSLASFRGELYATDDSSKCYRYVKNGSWSYCGFPERSDRLQCMMPYHGSLYAGNTDGVIFRYKGGTEWECVGRQPHGATQIHKLQVFGGRLFAGTWAKGQVLRYEGGTEWTDMGQLGISTEKFQINEVNDLQVYNGKLYAGVIPNGEVYRFENKRSWTQLRRLVTDATNSPLNLHGWSRVTAMAEFGGLLYCGTGTCHGRYDPGNPAESGRVYAMEAGKNAAFDDDLGGTWRHVAAVRDKDVVRLYVDGNLSSSSDSFSTDDYDLFNKSPLLIGFGAKGFFSGTLDDIRLYRGALEASQVAALHKSGAK